MKGGMSYEDVHQAALEKYGVSPFSVYHPDVIRDYPEYFNQFWLNFGRDNKCKKSYAGNIRKPISGGGKFLIGHTNKLTRYDGNNRLPKQHG
jgi:hypothetical protein